MYFKYGTINRSMILKNEYPCHSRCEMWHDKDLSLLKDRWRGATRNKQYFYCLLPFLLKLICKFHFSKSFFQAIGRPPMPPYWALGFHICRWGYGDLTEMKRVHEGNVAADIPFVSIFTSAPNINHLQRTMQY